MSKKIQAIIVGSIVIVLLVGALLALKFTKKSEPADETSSVDVEIITLFEAGESKLEYANVKNKDDEYKIELLGENKWGIKALDGLKQIEAMYPDTIDKIDNIYANEIIEENCTDLAKFGFDKPSLVAEIKFEGKDAFKITLGDISPDSYTRYAIITGENTVYDLSTSTLSSLLHTKYDYLDRLLISPLETGEDGNPIQPNINNIKINRNDLETPIELEEYKTGELSKNSIPGVNFKMVSPIDAMVDQNTAQQSIFGVFGLSADKAVVVKPTKEDLSKYGFDNPTSVFEMTYDETSSVKIIVGKQVENEDDNNNQAQYYVMREGTDIIYVLSKQSMMWIDLQVKDVMSSIAVLPPILDIDSVNINIGNESYLVKYIKGEDETDTNEIKASVNGKNVDVDASKKLLQLLYMTSIQDINKVTPTKPADCTVTYNYSNGKIDKVEFYVLEDRQIVISLNGNYGYLGRAGYVDKVSREVLNLVNGEKVDTDW